VNFVGVGALTRGNSLMAIDMAILTFFFVGSPTIILVVCEDLQTLLR